MRYLLGVMAGIVSGLVFSASSIAQKKAMNAIGLNAPVLKKLLKSPLWLGGFAASFALGAPLNMASYVALGPTLPPALASIGLAAIPLMSRVFLGERIASRTWFGTAMIAAGVALVGFSGIAIAPESIAWLDAGFLLRAGFSIGAVVLATTACFFIGLRSGSASLFPAIAAGLAQAVSNVFMGPIAGQIGRFFSGRLDFAGLAIIAGASLFLLGINAVAILLAQIALRRGTASAALPIQQLPVQLVPLFFHVFLYRGTLDSPAALACAAVGFPLLAAGALAFRRTTGEYSVYRSGPRFNR